MPPSIRPLASRIALITGAASGLGRATAERFVREGARVILCDLPSTQGLSIAADLCKYENAARAMFVATDVTQTDQVEAALNAAENLYGGSVDTVVNCAGIALARKTVSPLDDGDLPAWRVHDLESFERVLNVNVAGTFNVIRLAVERMVKSKIETSISSDDGGNERGIIVNTSSIAAYDGQIGQAAYAASKGAIVGMTLPLARDLASHGIRVNTIAPGLFRTPLLEALPPKVQQELGASVPFPSRLGKPDEYAALVQSIVENPMINAEVIRIDGGLRMPPK